MLYLNKLLHVVNENPTIFKSPNYILILGLTATAIKDLKKFAIENLLMEQKKEGCFLTKKGIDYLKTKPVQKWASKDFELRPDINIEYLKEEKTPSVLTKSIRLLAKNFLEKEPIKENSLEKALFNDLKKCENLVLKIEEDILSSNKILLDSIYNDYIKKGLTKSLISIIILAVLSRNLEQLAIYEKAQFQLKIDPLMFDRMIACPQNFEFQKTEMKDRYILKDISKIILHKKSENILEITKGLYKKVKQLDKYTMKTENLSKKTLRFRNTIINAKDPISLFEKEIPKSLGENSLQNCDREFLNNLKISLEELENCSSNLITEIKQFLLQSFSAKSKEELAERFLAIKNFIGKKELKILFNSVTDLSISDELWANRIATFINQARVPKDWTDEDFADFKVKTKELSLNFCILEATIGTNESMSTVKYHKFLNSFMKLSKAEQMIFLRKFINN